MRMKGNYWESLEQRRKELGVSYTALSERSGVSTPTLKRLFSGKSENPTLHSLQAVCGVLGVELRIGVTIEVLCKKSSEQIREAVATEKAKQIVKLVQGTSALESQAVGQRAVRAMVSRTVHELLAGPKGRLWSV